MVKVDNLEKKYGDYRLKVSLEIPKGIIAGVIGKNGAGKSTTIKAILGLIKPDSGSVQVFGRDASRLGILEKENIGVALADSGFSMYLNINDISSILAKMYHEFDKELFLINCKKQGLPTDKLIKDFSTGMKAKLRVLVAISHKAKLLILDEPTAGLDVEARNDILDMLRVYMTEDEERSILISSHISSDLESLCDDIYMIHEGKIILHEATNTILDEYALIKVDEKDYEALDKEYILKTKKEKFGYVCLTNKKQYYVENYPKLVIENGNIDDLILTMTVGD